MNTLRYRTLSAAKRAFTLIEIMVATVIMVVLVGLVIQITSEVLKVWSRSSGKLSANAEARIAMDLITQDLETAVFRNNGQQWLRAENGPEGPEGNKTVSLRLFSPALDRPNNELGDICAIAYQLENRDPVSGSSSVGSPDDRLWILYRLLVGPEDTFNKLMGDGNQDSLPGADKAEWKGLGGFSSNIIGNKGANYLVKNIIDFSIDFHVVDDGNVTTQTMVEAISIGLSDATRFGSGVPQPDIVNGATVGAQAYEWVITPSDQQLAYRNPLAYAVIRLTVISDDGARLLQNLDNIPIGISDIVQQHGEVFIRRVNFMAQPL